MLDDHIISKRMFSLCLGKNGGIFGIGGFNSDKHLEPVKWVNIHSNYQAQSYKFDIMGVSVNGHPIKGSHRFSSGFIDSGTTFSYLPSPLYDSILFHFDVFCDTANMYDNGNANKTKYCPSRIKYNINSDNEKVACFHYDREAYGNDTKTFFLGFPVIDFHIKLTDGSLGRINWYPSEYLYLDKDGTRYCLAADKGTDFQILFGSTLMR